MKNKIVFLSLLFIMIGFISFSLLRGSYANIEEDNLVLELKYNDNVEIFKDDIIRYINLMDDHIITNSSYNMSNVLSENYDFLTRFVISFVLDNQEYFDIILGDNMSYKDYYGIEYNSNKYIDMNTLYDITNKIFGVEYYYVLEEGLVYEDKLLLIDFTNEEFNLEIDSIIDMVYNNGYYDITIKYVDSDINYIYRFNADGERLVINNLSIKE